MSNFTHTLVKNEKEIHAFDKNMSEYLLLAGTRENHGLVEEEIKTERIF